jgi:hypothetical protein
LIADQKFEIISNLGRVSRVTTNPCAAWVVGYGDASPAPASNNCDG